MKKQIILLALALCTFGLAAQNNEPYEFKEFKRVAATEVKSQDQTGTCWAFSTASFLESEAQRLGKGSFNFSEMYVVRHIYKMKCENYVRRQGKSQFGEGGLAHDLIAAVKTYGIMPESDYPGRKDLKKPFKHSSLESSLKQKCDDMVKLAADKKLTGNWIQEIETLLDAEFGKVPLQFEVNGTMFTPTSYRDYLGINADDYVTITSFTHHPFYEKFILEIPDNWANGTFYNLPLNEMMRCLNYSIQQGYSVEWDADVSNRGFNHKNGVGIVPEVEWKDKDAAALENTFKMWEPEKQITQEYRQQLFDSQETMDDHLMHITAILNEEHGGLFYAVKNSWGETSAFKGYVNCSEAYLRLNTISFTVHKNALPQDTRRLLGLESGEVNIEKNKVKTGVPGRLKPSTSKTVPAQMAPAQNVAPASKQ